MMSLRAFTRAAPRTLTRSFSVAARPASRLPTAFSRPTSLQTSLTKYQYSAFSTARVLREPAGESDLELAAKLDDEAGHEQNNTATDAPAEAVRAFLEIESNPWKVSDVAGEQEIVLTRKFGNENIRATFTISDLQNLAEEDFNDLAESEFGEHGANQPGQAVGVHPEDQIAPADREFDENAPAFPVRVSITIEKPGKGALLIQTSAQDGVFEIEDVYHFAKAELANAETAEKDWIRQSLYGGPVYANLDEDLQALFERYLEERGFDAELANFIPDYITVKEQKEYARWLGNVKNFVSA